MPLDPARTVCRAPRAPGVDGRRERRPAGRLDGHVGAGTRLAARQGRLDGCGRGDRRGRQPVVHACRRRAKGLADRRTHRLGAERWLARRLPERDRRASRCCGGSRRMGRRRCRCGSSTGPTRRVRASAGRSSALRRPPGSMRDQDELAKLTDRDGVSLPDAVGRYGVSLDRALDARSQLENAGAYLELHIEQGPVLESMDIPLGVVLGTFGVERSRVTFRGQAAHAGSTPMDRRRDALAGAAKLALEIRDIAREVGDGGVCTIGRRRRKPGIVTSVVETAESLLDQRHLDADKLARLARAGEGGSAALRDGGEHRRRVGADLERSSRSSSTRRWSASRTRRSARSRARRTGCRRDRCTTRPRSRAQVCRR